MENIKRLYDDLVALRDQFTRQTSLAASGDLETFGEQIKTYARESAQNPDEITDFIRGFDVRADLKLRLQNLINNWITRSGVEQPDIEQYSRANSALTSGTNIIYAKMLPFNFDSRYVFSDCTQLALAPQLDFSTIELGDSLFLNCTALQSVGVFYAPKVRSLSSIFSNTAMPNVRVYAIRLTTFNNAIDNKNYTLEYLTIVAGRCVNLDQQWYGKDIDKVELDTSRTLYIAGFSRNSLKKNWCRVSPYFRVTNNATRISELFYNESGIGQPLQFINARHWDITNVINSSGNGSLAGFQGQVIGLMSQFSAATTFQFPYYTNAVIKHIYLMGDDADSGLHFGNTAHEGTALTLSNGVVYGSYSPQGLQSGDTYLNTDTMECFSYDGTRWNYERTIHPDMVGLQYGISHGAKGAAIELQNGNPVVVDAGALASALPNLKLGDTYLNTETFDAFVYTDDFTLCHGLLNSTYAGTAVRRDWNSTSKVYEITDTSGLTPAEGETYYNTETDQYFTYTNGAWVWRQASRWDVENAHWHRNCQVNPTKPNRKWFYVHYADDGVATDTTIRNDKVQSCAGDSPRTADNEFPVANWGTAAARNPHWEWRCKSVIERHMTLTGANITAQSLCNLIRHVHINEDNEDNGVQFKLNSNTLNRYAQGAFGDFEQGRTTTTVTGTYAAQAQAVLDALNDNAGNCDYLQFIL